MKPMMLFNGIAEMCSFAKGWESSTQSAAKWLIFGVEVVLLPRIASAIQQHCGNVALLQRVGRVAPILLPSHSSSLQEVVLLLSGCSYLFVLLIVPEPSMVFSNVPPNLPSNKKMCFQMCLKCFYRGSNQSASLSAAKWFNCKKLFSCVLGVPIHRTLVVPIGCTCGCSYWSSRVFFDVPRCFYRRRKREKGGCCKVCVLGAKFVVVAV